MENITTANTAARYINFSLGNDKYAVPLLSIREVLALPKVTPVPETPAYFLGLINLRGEVIPLIDLRKKLGIKQKEGAENSVIIFNIDQVSLAGVVDSVNSVLAPGPNEISPRPSIQSSKSLDYITGVYRKDNELILLMDPALFLNVDEKKIVSQLSKAAA